MYCSCVESSGWDSFETNVKKENENRDQRSKENLKLCTRYISVTFE